MGGVWSAVQSVADVVGILSFAAWLFSAALLLNARRVYRRRANAIAPSGIGRPEALAIGLGRPIEGAVRQYLKDAGLDMPVHAVSRSGIVLPPAYERILNEIRQLKEELTAGAVTELHLFYAGPVTLAMAVGTIVDNWVPTVTYQYEGGTYHPDVRLTRELSIGLAHPLSGGG